MNQQLWNRVGRKRPVETCVVVKHTGMEWLWLLLVGEPPMAEQHDGQKASTGGPMAVFRRTMARYF